jgi:tRNA(fMet)-specific endonuclease VapC
VSSYCLDTSAYSHFQRGHEQVVALVDQAEWLGIPTITLGELRAGFRAGARRERNEAELDEFLTSPVVEALVVDPQVTHHYATIVTDLRRAGTPLPTNDIWIAATAARHSATVLTYDEHFKHIMTVGTVILDPPPGSSR